MQFGKIYFSTDPDPEDLNFGPGDLFNKVDFKPIQELYVEQVGAS